MDIGDSFSISPVPLKDQYKDSLNIRDLFWYIKMEIFIDGKTQKNNGFKTVSQYAQQKHYI